MIINCNLRANVWAICCLGSVNLGGSFMFAPSAFAELSIVADQTLQTPTVVDYNPAIGAYIILQGTAQGQNLFHSFDRFSIPAGSEAFFYFDADTIVNIFARVTGNSLSEIEGVLGTRGLSSSKVVPPILNDFPESLGDRTLERPQNDFSSPDMSFFLINPNGIIFGEQAAIDTGGAFVATTASDIQFGEAGRFSAVNPESASPLLAIAPSAYLFAEQPQDIVSRSVRAASERSDFLGLRAYNGEAITLLGGDITIDGGNVAAGLNAFGGRVELGAITGPGRIEIGHEGRLLFPDDVPLGTVRLLNNARIDVGLIRGGDIVITADAIDLLERSALLAGISAGSEMAPKQAGDIVLQATGTLRLDQGRIANDVAPGAVGNSGNIEITSGNLSVTEGGQISASTFGIGNSGNVKITAADRVSLERIGALPDRSSAIFTRVESGAVGRGGDITVTASDLQVIDGAQISTSTFGRGDSGNIFIQANQSLTLASVETDGTFSGNIFTTVGVDPAVFGEEDAAIASATTPSASAIGNGGDINIVTGTLRVADGGALSAASFGQGNAGDVAIAAANEAIFAGTSADGQLASRATSAVGRGAVGNGGNIDIRTQGSVRILGETGTEAAPGLFASTSGTGNAGRISVSAANALNVKNGQISTSSAETSGGAITIAADRIHLTGNSDIRTDVAAGGGEGGGINLTSRYIFAFDDSDILASAREGRGGNITLNTRGFFGENFTPNSLAANPDTLNGNNRADINATGAVSGVVTMPNISFIENSLTDLPKATVPVEQVLAGSCIVRVEQEPGSFVVTGGGGLPVKPDDRVVSAYSVGDVQSLPDPVSRVPRNGLVEPTEVFELADGRLILSRECQHG